MLGIRSTAAGGVLVLSRLRSMTSVETPKKFLLSDCDCLLMRLGKMLERLEQVLHVPPLPGVSCSQPVRTVGLRGRQHRLGGLLAIDALHPGLSGVPVLVLPKNVPSGLLALASSAGP